jgi:hypothetical protein
MLDTSDTAIQILTGLKNILSLHSRSFNLLLSIIYHRFVNTRGNVRKSKSDKQFT